jgi:hypothetical protein
MIFWSCAGLLAAQLTASAQTLAHEYSFFTATNGTTNAVDLVGGANGTLVGTITNTGITGGRMFFDGTSYVVLPAGIITNDLAVTVEAWADYASLSDQGLWANLFDFGTQDAAVNDSYSISFCVNTSAHVLDAAISDYDNANVSRENCASLANPLDGATGAYIATVFDPPDGFIALYVNGVLNTKLPIISTITPGVRDLNNELGADNWNDPKLSAYLYEFRIWNGALNGLEVAASCENGYSGGINTNAGAITSLQLSAGAQVVQGGQEPSTVLATASLITNDVDVTSLCTYSSGNTNKITVDSKGGIHGVGIGSALITASYGGQSNSITVTVVEPVSILTHRYSFNDAQNTPNAMVTDSVGTLNGNLMGTAYETNGQAVLDGTAGCYVDLSSNLYSTDGMISGYQSATIDYWATFGTLGNWNYAWVMGNSTSGTSGVNYVHQVVRDGNTSHEIDETGAGFAMLGTFANETVHCTTVMDAPEGRMALYTNGVLSGVITNDFVPLSTIATNFAWIGRSLWYVYDPYVSASFDEFRVYNGTLTPQQIALADALGPNNTNLVVGALQSIQVSIPTLNLGDAIIGPVLANYGNLTNYNLTGNSPIPLFIFTSSNSNVVYQAADGKLHAVGRGTATVTATYGGFVSSQVVSVVHSPVLVNRYSFQDAIGSTTVADTVGGTNWNGTLPNGGTFTGTNLQLSQQWVQLPSGILSNYPAVSIDLWATFPDALPANCFLFGFGNTDSGGAGENYIFCQPEGGRIAICGVDPGWTGEQGTGGARNFSLQTNLHVTAVFDPPAGLESFYTNGVLASQITTVTVPMAFVQSVSNYLGRSLYTADSYIDVYFNEFRIYNGALTPAEVAASQILGPSALLTTGTESLTVSASGGNVVISWPAALADGFSLYSSSTLGPNAAWTLVSATPTIVGQNIQVSVPTSGTAKFYVLKR